MAYEKSPVKVNDRESWLVSSAALRGTSHDGSGLPCQDSIAFQVVGKWYVGVVSDGAGSAKKSPR